ncbi:MAG: hypothetical protein PUP92_03655 [Rhizonema sp. PD38]|nr:hypothetical protein [Rhizonema sp. PD38]
MRCLNCRLNGILQSTEFCPNCGVYLPSLLRDVLAPGTLLRGGDYRIDYALGRGGFGITYRASHTYLELNLYEMEITFGRKLHLPQNRQNQDIG